MIVIDDENVFLFFDHEYEFNDFLFVVVVIDFEFIERSMFSSFLKKMYNFEHEMQKIFNDFSKQHDYFIIKKNTERDRRNLKNKIYFRCTRKNEIENTSTDKRKIVSKRIKCFFKIYDIFIENNK